MPNAGEVRLDLRIDELESRFATTRVLHIRTRLLVYRRSDADKPELIEERPDLELLLDPAENIRILRHRCADPEEFDRRAATARLIDVPITCHEAQVEPIVNDSAKIIGMIAGNRAGKTEVLGSWLLRQWVLHGFAGALFWWVAPTLSLALIGLRKLFAGEGDRGPIFPPELVRSYPKAKRLNGGEVAEMIDGSLFAFHHANSDGDNLKGVKIVAAGVDEVCSVQQIQNWRIICARTADMEGRVGAASTPKRGHWARSEIINQAQYSDDVRHYRFSCFDNPWIKQSEIERLIQTQGGHDDPVVRREYYGEFVADGNDAWPDWNPEHHLVQDREAWTIRDLVRLGLLPEGYKDITAQVVAGRFSGHRDAEIIGGQDFNVNPMTGVFARLFGIPGDPRTWGAFFFDELQVRGPVQHYAEELAAKYPGIPISCDSTGCKTGIHSSHGAGSGTNDRTLKEYGFDARPCYAIRGEPKNPLQVDSLNLCHRLFRAGRIRVHSRCRALCLALDTQEVRPDGRIDKDPGTATDRLSAPSDAMRYALWRLFWEEMRTLGKAKT